MEFLLEAGKMHWQVNENRKLIGKSIENIQRLNMAAKRSIKPVNSNEN